MRKRFSVNCITNSNVLLRKEQREGAKGAKEGVESVDF